jgi:hypothetical protein
MRQENLCVIRKKQHQIQDRTQEIKQAAVKPERTPLLNVPKYEGD